MLFGGLGANGSLGDTWEYDGRHWVRSAVLSGPVVRSLHALAHDAERMRTVLFAGFDGTMLDDTWEYDGTNWLRRQPASSPSARRDHAMAYDSLRSAVVLFGGSDAAQALLADTWEYDGTVWVRQSPAQSPPGRSEHAMAFTSDLGCTLLFAGRVVGAPPAADTWRWSAGTWTPEPPSVVTARHRPAMAHDVRRGRTLTYGGVSPQGVLLMDTWEHGPNGWIAVAPTTAIPRSRSGATMTHDLARDRTLLVGGGVTTWSGTTLFGETWEFTPVARPAATVHGVGCAGPAGTPSLVAAAGALPALGSTVVLETRGLPPGGTGVYLAFGTELVRWNMLPLPIDLGPLGLAGCRLWIAPTTGVVMFSTNGVATWSLPVPVDPALAGATIAAQALVLDPASAAGLAAVSNAVILLAH